MPASTVIPVLAYEDVAQAITWLCRTFGYGERQYTAADPAGHRWTFSQTVADVAPVEWGGVATR